MGEYENIIVEATGPVARLTLNRPERLNALSLALISDVIEGCRELSESDARVVIISGAGRAFSAGFDLSDFASSVLIDGSEQDRYESADRGGRMAVAIEDLPQVTIAAMRGPVVGGGLVLAVASDLRVASEDMVITIPEVELGIGYAWGAIPRLVQEIGPALTRELVMTSRPFPAREAFERGLLNRVVPPDDLDDEAMRLAEVIASRPAKAIGIVKRHVIEVIRHDFSRDDAADLVAALDDPESVEARRTYLTSQGLL